jgi:DNA primase
MHDVSNTTGLDGYDETSGETGNSSDTLTGKAFYQDLIRRANTVPLIYIFKHYGLHINENNRRAICPFKSHKGGRESSGSFWYYPETNTYHCFGCRQGYAGSNFVAIMDGIIISQAAFKIISLFNGDVDVDAADGLTKEDFSEQLEIMMDFSNTVREFRQSFFDEKSQAFIDEVCSVYDQLNLRHKKITNEALRRTVDQFKKDIIFYTSCHTL